MLTQQEAEARVAKGAAYLDAMLPDWHRRIDVGTLTMWDPCQCIVGQLSPVTSSHAFAARARDLFGHDTDTELAVLGVDVTDLDVSIEGNDTFQTFQLLQDAWIAAIAARRIPDPQPAYPVEDPVAVA